MLDVIKGQLGHSFHLYPIIAIAVCTLLLITERFVALYLSVPMRKKAAFIAKIRKHISSNQIDDAIAWCEVNSQYPVARIFGDGLSRAHHGEASVRNALELALSEVTEKLASRTPFLATLANVSTLLGLCGTVVGLMRSFGSLGEVANQARGAAMATGISTAMNSTLYGLAVAVVCMIAYSILNNRASKLIVEMEQSAIQALDLVLESYQEGSQVSDGERSLGGVSREAN